MLAVDENLLPFLRLVLYRLAEGHQILADVSVVIPGHMNILRLLERRGTGGGRRVFFREKLERGSVAHSCESRVWYRRITPGARF